MVAPKLDSLLKSNNRLRTRGLLTGSLDVPSEPGIYAWWSDEPPLSVTDDWCIRCEGAFLIYAGIAPRNPESASDLHQRIMTWHLRGTARGSTLRKSLGSVLRDRLRLEPRPLKKGKFDFGGTEAVLTDWMAEHTSVSWLALLDPWLVEREAIQWLHPPLNLDFNSSHPCYQVVKGAREESARIAHGTDTA